MKKLLISALFIFAFSAIKAQSSNAIKDVPQQIKTYISKYFPTQTIVQYEKEVKLSGTEYEINLSDFTELEFNSKFEPVKLDAKGKLPESVIPANIWSYVKSNYPDLFIQEWKKKYNRQEIELNNDVELHFDLKGNFLRIDD